MKYYPVAILIAMFVIFMVGGWIPALAFIAIYAGMAVTVNHFTRKEISDRKQRNLPR